MSFICFQLFLLLFLEVETESVKGVFFEVFLALFFRFALKKEISFWH